MADTSTVRSRQTVRIPASEVEVLLSEGQAAELRRIDKATVKFGTQLAATAGYAVTSLGVMVTVSSATYEAVTGKGGTAAITTTALMAAATAVSGFRTRTVLHRLRRMQ